MTDLNQNLAVSPDDIAAINSFLTSKDNPLIQRLTKLIESYGGAEAINEKARQARDPEKLMQRLKAVDSPYVADLEWLMARRDEGAFVSMDEYCKGVLGKDADLSTLNTANAVTLEISALQFFPWLIEQARQSIANKELMPGRIIRVRNMKEQVEDQGDILATALAMQIIGATYVESLDTRGTDGCNIHLGGPDTITGYFTGIGQPNDHPYLWAQEYLEYYTRYGIQQVLNINPGTILLGYFMHRMGVDIQFKISVFVGNDNPFFILWTLMTARMFARPDGSTSLVGFNLSNAVDNNTIMAASEIRKNLGLENQVRFEHHITETYKSIVCQPYNRRDELIELAKKVPNVSAKHEGGETEVEEKRDHPSDILNYFLTRQEIMDNDLMEKMQLNYLDKHHSVNLTARALIESGTGVIAARHLHSGERTGK